MQLGAMAENIKKRKEAEEAARGGPAMAGLKAAKPKETESDKPAPIPATPPETKPTPKPVEQMPKDELDALRIAEQKRYEERQKARDKKK